MSHNPEFLFLMLKETFPNRAKWDLVERFFVPSVLMPLGAKMPEGTTLEENVEMIKALAMVPDLMAVWNRRAQEASA